MPLVPTERGPAKRGHHQSVYVAASLFCFFELRTSVLLQRWEFGFSLWTKGHTWVCPLIVKREWLTALSFRTSFHTPKHSLQTEGSLSVKQLCSAELRSYGQENSFDLLKTKNHIVIVFESRDQMEAQDQSFLGFGDKHVLVTGASGGIGISVSKLYAAHAGGGDCQVSIHFSKLHYARIGF